MTTYHKAVRPDGTSFNDSTFRWVPEKGDVTGIVVTHPDPGRDDASGYLSVATVPTDCTGMCWPARHLIVEPVEGSPVFAPDGGWLPNKRAAHAWRVAEERPAHELLGPQGAEVSALIESFKDATAKQWEVAATASDAVPYRAWSAARGAAGCAARGAARYAAGDAAWGATGYAAGYGAGDAAGDAARALTLRDLVGIGGWSAWAYNTLTEPLRAAGFPYMEEVR